MRRLAHHVWRKTRVVKLRPPKPGLHFHEEQLFPVTASFALTVIGTVAILDFGVGTLADEVKVPAAVATIIGMGGILALAIAFKVHIEVYDRELLYGVWPFFKRVIAVGDIIECCAFTRVPQGNFVRWGYYAIWVPDTHGVSLRLRSGKHFTLIADHADGLAMVIRELKGIGVAQ